MSAATMVLEMILGVNDDDAYSLRVIERVARRQGEQTRTDLPGLVFLEIDGLAAPVLRRAMRDGNAPVLARWLTQGTHRLIEWETDLSSQTGASQAGILLGSNHDIPAFRWVEKETGRTMTCSAPGDCAEIERRHATGRGLLTGGGASRGNLLSGEADEVILTVSRMDAEKRANPGYRAFLANGFNVTRELVLFTWEVALEYSAAIRQRRREVIPRGKRGGRYPFLRAALCVVVRDLIVYGVLSDIMRGRPAIYATFSSYDEVAHHSGLERVDTLEALRKLDQQLGRIERALRFAPRPYKLVVLSDHGQTQGRTFKQRNGYGLDELVQRSLAQGTVSSLSSGDEHDAAVGQAVQEATGASPAASDGDAGDDGDRPAARVVVLGSGNLGLIYLMEEKRRLSSEEIEERHPRLLAALAAHPDIGFLLVRSAEHGPLAINSRGINYLAHRRVQGADPLAPFSPNAAAHLLRSDGFEHVADIMVGSFYDPELEQGCAFEELISFHGGLGGTADQTVFALSGRAPDRTRSDRRGRFSTRASQRLATPAPARVRARASQPGRECLTAVTPGRSELTYVGHATVLIQLAATRFLTDPLLGDGILHVRRRAAVPDLSELASLDAILISHAHRDHLDQPSLRRLAGHCPVIVPRGGAQAVRSAGAHDVIEVEAGDRISIGDTTVEAVYAAHHGRRSPLGPRFTALGYVLDGRSRVYFAGDTDLFSGMSALAGRIDLALLPIWGWGSRVPRGHLDPVRAAEAVARIRPGTAVPIHWGTLRAFGAQRGLDPIAPAQAFAQQVGRVAPATEVRILLPGERMPL